MALDFLSKSLDLFAGEKLVSTAKVLAF